MGGGGRWWGKRGGGSVRKMKQTSLIDKLKPPNPTIFDLGIGSIVLFFVQF